MKACKFCGVEVENTKRKCPNCGSTELIRVCENCGEHFEGNFCPKCGVKMGQKGKTCPECQTVYFTNACPNCGYSALRKASSEPVHQTVVHKHVYVNSPMPQKTRINVTVKKKKKRWWLWIIVILLIAGIFGGGQKGKTKETKDTKVTVTTEAKEENKTVKETNTPDAVVTEAPSKMSEAEEKDGTKASSGSSSLSEALLDAIMDYETPTAVPTVDITAKMDQEAFLSVLNDNVSWYLMPRDRVEKISLIDRKLVINIHLAYVDKVYDRYAGVTDYILSVRGGYDLWDSVTIDFGDRGLITKTKDDVISDENGLHFSINKNDKLE